MLDRNYARPPPSEEPKPAPAGNPNTLDHHNHPHRLPAYSETAHRVDDEILCSRTVWIIAAIIGVIILTLILLFAFGVFGGKGSSSSAAPAAAAPTSTSAAGKPSHHLTLREFNHDGEGSSETHTVVSSGKEGRHLLEMHDARGG